MGRGQISRGDLLRAVLRHGGQLPAETAESLGFRPEPRRNIIDCTLEPLRSTGTAHVEQVEDTRTAFTPQPLLPVPFWQPQEFSRDAREVPEVKTGLASARLPTRTPESPPSYQYLAEFNDLVPRLRAALSEHRPSRSPDIPQIIDRLSQAEILSELPRLHRPGWGSSLYVIEDRSDYLAPYVRDQAWLQSHLGRLYPETGFFPAIYSECLGLPQVFQTDGRVVDFHPQPGDQVLVLGDLGCLARDGGRARGFWTALGEQLCNQGVVPLALLPCGAAECPESLAARYQLLSWEHPAPEELSPEELEERGQILLVHLSICPRVEPRLLRAIRLQLGAERFPVRLETWVWQHAAMDAPDLIAAALGSEEARTYREQFKASMDRSQATATLRAVKKSMSELPYELWLEPVLNLSHWDRDSKVITEQERQDSRELLNWLADRVTSDKDAPLSSRSKEWLHGVCDRLDEQVRQDAATKEACWQLDRYFAQEGGVPLAKQPVQIQIMHQGDRLHFLPRSDRPNAGSPVAEIFSGDGLVILEAMQFGRVNSRERLWISPDQGQIASLPDKGDQLHIRTDREQLTLRRSTLADFSWADAMGRDRFGLWAEFVIEGRKDPVRQRMRWIPPGRFLMGSPEDEPGRYPDEGPQHQVTISQGFWLFDTPVTQALWQAVMGDNPSKFKTSSRPVERVSWDDCQEFLQKINTQHPGLDLSLPGESQWEYACRAGSTTALYSGPIEIIGDANAPALDDIAWYGGNSGEGFELDNGQEISYLDDRQFASNPCGTHPVAQKQPNAWGLYDMLGNVWEWVADPWHEDYDGAPEDGRVWEDDKIDKPGGDRVIRGGSWSNEARYCRSAYRLGREPDGRGVSLGFRCVRVQE